jgi:A/G-specific adenine glycosylase
MKMYGSIRRIFKELHKSTESLVDFGHKLVMWYNRHKRALPWRETSDPYRILVSETMLQQTRVETVIPYYQRFLEQFPTFESLAAANVDDVMKMWQGLGYYSRARNLQRAANVVAGEHGGTLPDDVTIVGSLPGVGPYTTGAVMSIAFNQPVAAVDGNVLRVMSRYLGIDDPIDDPPVKRAITEHVQAAVETSEPRHFTQALMELGAMVCTPRNPQCLLCPVREGCVANATGQTGEIPKKRAKKARKQLTIVALWLEYEGQLLVERRQDKGLLAGMWQLPSVEIETNSVQDQTLAYAAAQCLEKLLSGHTENELHVRETENPVRQFTDIARAKHIFTHVEWNIHVLRPVGYHHQSPTIRADSDGQFVPVGQLNQLVWPKVYENILRDLLHIDVADPSVISTIKEE